MKVAIVSPHPVPFAVGGAENLWWGLQQQIIAAGHQCDLVTLISPERSFRELIAAYEAFSQLDLSAYDCVISGKYPAWMVRHPNHVCYMLHRLRGLYDSYMPQPDEAAVLRAPRVRQLVQWIANLQSGGDPDDQVVLELFDRVRRLADQDLPAATFAFPGPLARLVFRFLDDVALSPQRIRRYAAISETVRTRSGYFPPDVPVDVLHPPPHRNDYRTGAARYFFTASRLDAPKRIDMIIAAMRHVDADIPLLIAGTGPEAARLEALAAGDRRIRFLGFVPDDDLPGFYADALAVPFVPLDEDYGLITIEAMRSGKPVVTVRDAGGACELVRDGETGYITEADPAALGQRLAELASDPSLAQALGDNARRRGAQVTWEPIVSNLLDSRPLGMTRIASARRPKLTVATTFPVHGGRNGGQLRVFHLYRNLARDFDVTIVSLTGSDQESSQHQIAPGLFECAIPRSPVHEEIEREMAAVVGGIPVSDIMAHEVAHLTPAYVELLEAAMIRSDAVIACHPYLVGAITAADTRRPLWYEAQDVEWTLKSAQFSRYPEAGPLLDIVRATEKTCWQDSELVFACADRDLEALTELYGPTRAAQLQVPNGVALDEIVFTDLDRRRAVRAGTGLETRQTALFMGSWHGPNIEAVESILVAAQALPTTAFIIVGSVCAAFAGRDLPANVSLLGQVPDVTRNDLLAMADVALNPMQAGSGTNLKMLDYFAAGVPVLSTAFGARGLRVVAGRHFVAAESGDLADGLRQLAGLPDAELSRMVRSARELVEAHYSWATIADHFRDAIAGHGLIPSTAPAHA